MSLFSNVTMPHGVKAGCTYSQAKCNKLHAPPSAASIAALELVDANEGHWRRQAIATYMGPAVLSKLKLTATTVTLGAYVGWLRGGRLG